MDKTTEALVRRLSSLSFESLTEAAVHEAKRHLIDSFGCAMGGYTSEPSVIARRMAAGFSAKQTATVLGEGTQASPEAAAFANSCMVRFLDANDSYNSVGSGHPSDIRGAVLAAAEIAKASGKDLVAATVAGYELFGIFADVMPIRDRGWDQSVFIAPASAISAGLLLGLSHEQLANAISIAITANVATRNTRAGELSMWKGCATPHAAKAGLFAAMLAAEGMTGPTAAFEGDHGVWQQVLGWEPSYDVGQAPSPAPEALPEALEGRRGGTLAIQRCSFKYFAAEFHAQAPITTVLAFREQVKPEDVEALNVEIYKMAYGEIGSGPSKWDPRNRETADHSLPYMLAAALQDGRVTPDSFEPARYLDPALRPVMARIHVSENPEFTSAFPKEMRSSIELVTRSGQRIKWDCGYAKGHVNNPMSDQDVENKFRDLCSPGFSDTQTETALKALWAIDQASDISPVLQLFTIKR